MHELMAATLDTIIGDIQRIKSAARDGSQERPRWPMIVLRTPKGWTCPKEIDGRRTEDYWRSHQVPMGEMHDKPEHVRILEDWMKSYRPDELFDESGRLRPELAKLAPRGERRMSANPHTNGGLLLRDLRLPDFRDYAIDVTAPGAPTAESTRLMGAFLRDVMKLNMDSRNFRLFSPDESNSNRWQDALEVTNRAWMADTYPWDDHLAPDGRVMEMLSEHQCQGWLEGYLLTGRHGFFSCYEAFIHIIDSMFNQHAKWLKVCNEIPWRRPIGSLNYLLSSHVWRQDHNGFSHQDPGFIDHVVNKKAEVVRVYLPPDANTLLSVTDHCVRSRNYVNVIVAGKQPAPQWLTMDEAIKHCEAGLGIWDWASNDRGGEPDVVMACCGDVPTLETLAAVDLLRRHVPELKVRVINIVDLMKLQPPSEHPHGLSDNDFDALFTTDKPIIFAYHGYPWLIHRLTYRRNGHNNLHVRGYKEEGTTSTPFDMCVMNDHRPLSPVRRCDRPGAEPRRARRLRQAGDPRQADRSQTVHRPVWRRHAGDQRLAVGPGSGFCGREFDRGRQRIAGTAAVNVFAIRHGETAWSLSGQHTGTTDIPLTENGQTPGRTATAGAEQGDICSRARQPAATGAWRPARWPGSPMPPITDHDLVEWNYGDYEGLTPKQIHATRPGWLVFRDGCPGGEMPDQVGARVDRVIARARAATGDVALFAHGHVLRVLAARWIGLPAGAGQHFLLDTGTLCILGYYRDVPAVRVWNGPLIA